MLKKKLLGRKQPSKKNRPKQQPSSKSGLEAGKQEN